jgi:hypothetical protein
MIYSRFQKLISVAMALLVFISTLSVSIEKHYCCDHLIDFAIFANAEKCASETSDDGSKLMAQSCCKDVVDLFEGQNELSLEKTTALNPSQKVFILSIVSVFGELHDQKSQNNTPFKHYTPPKFIQDIHILHEVFLI